MHRLIKGRVREMVVSESSWQNRVAAVGDFFDNVTWLEEPRVLYQSIADEMVSIVGCDTVSLRMLSVARDEMIGYATSGSAKTLVKESFYSLPITIGRMPNLVETHEPIVYDLLHPDESDVKSERGIQLGYRYAVTVPLLFEDDLIGVVDFIYREGQFSDDDLPWLAELCRIVGSIMGMIGVSERMTELRIADEAKRIGIELHDSLAQPVSVVALEADKALMALDEGDVESLRTGLLRLREASLQACNSIRQEALALNEASDEHEDLSDVIGRFVARYSSQWGIRASFEEPENDVMVTKKVSNQVMRILNEALGNVVRHAHANEVVVGLTSSNGLLSLRVEDDGNGFDMRSIPEEKMGLRLMKERASRVGGKLVVASVPGEGTSLVADIPLSA